jgi:hypothetical protein
MSRRRSSSPPKFEIAGSSYKVITAPIAGKKYGVQDDEFCFKAKQMFEQINTKESRLLVVGKRGLRLLVPGTEEEIANYSYYVIREFNLNETAKTFDFEYKDTAANEYKRLKFKTKESLAIQNHINEALKQILKEHHIDNPDQVLADNTKVGPAHKSSTTSSPLPQRRRSGSHSKKRLSQNHGSGGEKLLYTALDDE